MSNPPWATDTNTGSMGNDLNLRTGDINIPYRKNFKGRNSNSLKTDDIIPRRKHHLNRIWDNKHIGNLNTGDIAGQHNRLQHPLGPAVKTYGRGSKPDYSLNVRDIEGAFAKRGKTPRRTNPLEPQYKLPKHEVIPAPQPKFIRDQIGVQDIDGARFKSKYKHIKTRPTNRVHDIKGTKSMPHTFLRTRGHAPDVLDHKDITDTHFKSKRVGHSPLEPSYSYGRSSDLDVATILDMPAAEALKQKLNMTKPKTSATRINKFGNVKGSRPKGLKLMRQEQNRSMGLRTSDVPGAYRNWKPEWAPKRSQVFNPTRTDDIKGAQAGSKKKFRTKRSVHPLAPQYKLLDTRSSQLRSTGREISQVTLG
mmetsp:Transcript_8622/g.15920  ORF Transcript_8622/g.15920 Transcript_8622/m.15920 type:complete len:364 (-) Transcript_8622:151-1242(-)